MHTDYFWETDDRTKIFTREWKDSKPIKGIIIIIHGIGEHISRYRDVAAFFNDNGFLVTGMDLRGHGHSGGQRGYGSFSTLLKDITRLIERIHLNYPALPIFIYGHSMGANLTLHYATEGTTGISGLIATAPIIAASMPIPAIKVLMGRITYHLLPRFTMPNGIDPSGLSRDRSIVDAYSSDPLVHNKITSRLGMDLIDSGKWLMNNPIQSKSPILLMQGSADSLVNSDASIAYAQTLDGRCTFKLWPGFYHELHNEPEKTEVLTYIVQWINTCLEQPKGS